MLTETQHYLYYRYRPDRDELIVLMVMQVEAFEVGVQGAVARCGTGERGVTPSPQLTTAQRR